MSTATLVKKDLILGGLACAHCAEEIGEAVKKIKGIENSNMNFVNKKLTLQIAANYNEKEIINRCNDTKGISNGNQIQQIMEEINR